MKFGRVALVVSLSLGVLLAPLAADAQPAAKVPRIGVLMAGHPPTRPGLEAFRQGLRDLGHVEGQTVVLEIRWDEGKPELLREQAAELARLNVDVLVARTPAAIRAAQQANRTMPIVCPTFHDPVVDGLVASLARPGGTVTGLSIMSQEINPKRLELLREAAPRVSRVAVLFDPGATARPAAVKEVEAAARSLGLQIEAIPVRGPNDFDAAFKTAIRRRAGAVLMFTSPLFSIHSARLVELALKHRLPTMSGEDRFAEAGGLMKYGPSITDSYRRAATYVDKILKGAKPGELPIERPTRFELEVNLRTAKALGLTIPPSVLIRADRVIE